MLDLVITHWTEPWEIGKKAFQMLAVQRLVNWDDITVTLIHDGSEAFPDEYFADCPFEVHQVCIPHGGIAAARNYSIDHCNGEWIKWCDFDDMFVCSYSLNAIMNVLYKAQDYDLLWFPLVWEHNDGRRFLKDERDPVFIHNKVFRKSMIAEKGLRFPEHLTWCEDSAFLAVMEMEIDHQRIGKIISDMPIYAYFVRDGSLCNRPEIKFANLQSFFQRHIYVAEEFRKRGLMDQYYTMCLRVMCDSYCTLYIAKDIPEDRSEHEKRVWQWYDEHVDAVKKCRAEMVPWVMNAVNRESRDGTVEWNQIREWIENHERGEAEWQQRQAI